jgi:hypothetical protein
MSDRTKALRNERRTDITLCPHTLYSLCKPLINSNILLKCRALEEEFGFGRVGDCIMKTRPKDLYIQH